MICPNLKCRKVLQVPGKCRGQHVKCRYCGLTFAVPTVRHEPKRVEKEATSQDTKENGKEAKKEEPA
jgi:hypothetical protein